MSRWPSCGHRVQSSQSFPEDNMNTKAAAAVALLYPGDRAVRERADPAESRFAALFEAFAAAGMHAAPAVYHDDFADEVASSCAACDAVLVWCNPIEGGRRRDRLDAMLRDVARSGRVRQRASRHDPAPGHQGRAGRRHATCRSAATCTASTAWQQLARRIAAAPAARRARAQAAPRPQRHRRVARRVRRARPATTPRLNLRHAQRGSEEDVRRPADAAAARWRRTSSRRTAAT